MSCENNPNRVARAAKANGIARTGSKSAFLAGGDAGAQVPFWGSSPLSPLPPGKLPEQRKINLSPAFSPEELQAVSTQLRLANAAVARRIGDLLSGVKPAVGRSDPRPLDWARLDRKQYRFILKELTEARYRRKDGLLDTGSLKKQDLVELQKFCEYESDRARRNIDGLRMPLGGIGGPTAGYLTRNHKLIARFFNYLANQIEPMVGEESQEELS
jgi:hypothetical protein